MYILIEREKDRDTYREKATNRYIDRKRNLVIKLSE